MATEQEIRDAIRLERSCLHTHHDFVIYSTEQDGPVWKVFVDPMESQSGLDESLEGAGVWWLEPGGTAEVLSADPDSDLLSLRFVTGQLPGMGGRLRVYPPQFLDALEHFWSEPVNSNHSIDWLESALLNNQFESTRALRNEHFPRLRSNQNETFALPGWPCGFLWGPPGTGKTTTLGTVLATYLFKFPGNKVLLLSTTNSAVDIALVKVDEALEQMGQAASLTRRRCLRLGNHFLAKNYIGREHLVPVPGKELLSDLARLEATKPGPRDAREYHIWKQAIEKIRAQLRTQTQEAVRKADLVALTACRAVFTLDALREHAPFDLVVFDEASQVSIPYALAIAPLGRACLFAGDPEQLAPIVQSDQELAQKWMGNSMFYWSNQVGKAACFLNEQSRMAAPICELVSKLFYSSRLQVASKEAADPRWHEERANLNAPPCWRGARSIQSISQDGTYSQKYHGWIRFESAERVRDIVVQLLDHTDAEEIIVLTPFRAQRSLIRTFLRNAGVKRVTVSTVHRAQGSERHTVIFDPVCGGNQFLQTAEARRLFNVAISRAKARILLLLSAVDTANPILGSIARLIKTGGSGVKIDTVPTEDDVRTVTIKIERRQTVEVKDFSQDPSLIRDVIDRIDFPNCILGKMLDINGNQGVVVEILNGGKSIQLQEKNGRSINFNVAALKRAHSARNIV